MSKNKIEITIAGGSDGDPREMSFEYLGEELSGPRDVFVEMIVANLHKPIEAEVRRRMVAPR